MMGEAKVDLSSLIRSELMVSATHAFQNIFMLAVAIACASIIFCLLLRNDPGRQAPKAERDNASACLLLPYHVSRLCRWAIRVQLSLFLYLNGISYEAPSPLAMLRVGASRLVGMRPTRRRNTGHGVASPDTLTAYHWQLDQTPVATAQPVQLTFADQRMSVTGLCNNLMAGYNVNGAAMKIQQVAGTMRMCNDQALMKYEQEVGARLEKIKSWAIAGAGPEGSQATPVLTLKFDDDSQWTLNGKPTDETKYGSAGETVFLEIQPQLVACNHPLIPNKQCMQVRTVEYDGSGIKRKLGEWQAFYGDIEGYRHEAGVRNILRVKRYTLRQPARRRIALCVCTGYDGGKRTEVAWQQATPVVGCWRFYPLTNPAACAIRNNPAPMATTPMARATRSPAGARRSAVMAAVTTAIARRSMTPTTSRIAVRPAQQ